MRPDRHSLTRHQRPPLPHLVVHHFIQHEPVDILVGFPVLFVPKNAIGI